MRHFFGLGPGDEAAVATAVPATRLGYPEQASALGPKAADEPRPTLMRTPADTDFPHIVETQHQVPIKGDHVRVEGRSVLVLLSR
jgi:hypothetical protein